MNKITIKDVTFIVVLTAILFVQESLLSFIPNFQLTVFLLVLYSKKLGIVKTTIIIIVHVLLDTLLFGSMNFIYFPFMLIGWIIIPFTLNTIFKKVNSNISLAFLGVLFSFIYCWIYIIPNILFFEVRFMDYLVQDILWEIILAASSFLTIILLYNPCSKLFERLLNNEEAIK